MGRMPRSNLISLKFSTIRRAKALSNITFYYFFLVFLVATNGGMGDVAASVGFAGWVFAVMCDHALFIPIKLSGQAI
jgi:hypothetical protein